MKKIILSLLMVIASTSAFAEKPTVVATCDLTHTEASPHGVIGKMEISHWDNGDEGFLIFKYALNASEAGTPSTNEFTDNIQDEGTAFLTPGAEMLYISLEGTKSSDKRPAYVAAVYLKNKGGKITGTLKSDFFRANLVCKAK